MAENNNFFSEFKSNVPQIKEQGSVDLSGIDNQYIRQFGEQEQIENLMRQRDLAQSYTQAGQQQQQALANQSRTLDVNALGVYGQNQRTPLDIQQEYGLGEKEYAKVVEPVMQKDFRVQRLREELAGKQMRTIQKSFQKDMQSFSRGYEQLRKTVANKMMDDRRERNYNQQLAYKQSLKNIEDKILSHRSKSKGAGTLGTLLGAGAGFILSGFNPMGAVTGGRIGGDLAKGGYNLFSNRGYGDSLSSGINL